jgi:maltose O-acetyltransferase
VSRRTRELIVNSIVYLFPHRLRVWVLGRYSIESEPTAFLAYGTKFIDGSAKVSIGKSVYINDGCVIIRGAPITIGDQCNIGFGAMLCTITHQSGDRSRRAGMTEFKPIVIGNGCWIGARATILPGVTIGDSCVIAAGAVVTKDCEPNGMYAGVPARRMKELEEVFHEKSNFTKAI